MEASTDAGVGRELNMLGTYLVSSCRGGLPAADHCCWKSPKIPGEQKEKHTVPYSQHRESMLCSRVSPPKDSWRAVVVWLWLYKAVAVPPAEVSKGIPSDEAKQQHGCCGKCCCAAGLFWAGVLS
jgi:hypothetical protein